MVVNNIKVIAGVVITDTVRDRKFVVTRVEEGKNGELTYFSITYKDVVTGYSEMLTGAWVGDKSTTITQFGWEVTYPSELGNLLYG